LGPMLTGRRGSVKSATQTRFSRRVATETRPIPRLSGEARRNVPDAVQILGILNITRDSYSDGGSYFAPEGALEHARALRADGAARIDVGAESSHPDAEDVPADEEIRRMAPVVERLVAQGAEVSVDTCKPAVMRRMLDLGVHCINDITALREPGALAVAADSRCDVILMHSTSSRSRAERQTPGEIDWIARITEFFAERIDACERSGIARERLILDPGMGLFLSSEPGPSLVVLKRLDELRRFGLRLCLSPSRKSFVGALLGRAVGERGAGSLATEIWCAQHRVEWIRTHDVRALADALRMIGAIERA